MPCRKLGKSITDIQFRAHATNVLSSLITHMTLFSNRLPQFLNLARHVHGFLQEIGQGIQHIASRVEDLVAFVQRANDIREITGEVRF